MNAPLWTSAEAEAATGGHSTAAWQAAGISIDSRGLDRGDLFVALAGPNFDGHDFIAGAAEAGAAAAMVAKSRAVTSDRPLLVVDDTLAGLTGLARAARARSDARIVAVTGSVGKTGTKEALKLVLGRQGETTANLASLNNQWGVPLSLARLPRTAKFGVFEMGMNHAGEIRPLSHLAAPHVAVVTGIDMVHSEHFGSLMDIADAKAEIFAGMPAGAAVVLNRDSAHFHQLAGSARAQGIERIAGFGRHADAVARLMDCRLDRDGSDVSAVIDGKPLAYRVGAPGTHWVLNSLAVLAVVHLLDADLAAAAAALAELAPPEGRGHRHRLALADGEIEIIDESYNASPASMRAMFELLALTSPGPGGRRVAVLADMRELGASAQALHARLAVDIGHRGIDLVFTAGPLMANLAKALPAAIRGGHAEDCAALAPVVAAMARPGDVIAVKGSFAMHADKIVEALRAHAEDAPKAANG